jgi:putative PEP-CTERM system TPR-repeat lipoprotein
VRQRRIDKQSAIARAPRIRAATALGGCLLLAALLCACGVGRSDEQILATARRQIASHELRGAAIELKGLLQREPEHAQARALLGEVLYLSGDIDGAVSELERARERGAPMFETTLSLARAHFARQRHDAVFAELNKLEPEGEAQRAAVAEMRGAVLLVTGHHAEARASLEAALVANPSSAGALRALAEATFELEGLDAAEHVLDRARRLAAEDPGTWLTSAALHARAGKLAQAKERFERAASLARAARREREEIAALAGLADLHLTLAQLDLARRTLGELQSLAPHSGTLKLLRAREAFLTIKYPEARLLLEEILSVHPHNRAAQLLLGAVNFAQGNLEQADMYLSSVVAAEPRNFFAVKLLTDTRLRQHKPDAAWDVLEAILSDSAAGADPKLLGLAGSVRLRSGDTAGGLSLLERSVAENPTDRDAKLRLAAAYVGSGRLEHAIKLLGEMKATQDGPQRRELLLIAAYVRNDDLDAACRLGDSLLQRQDDDAGLTSFVAALHAAVGETAKARTLLEHAHKLAPRDPAPLIGLGRLELAANNFDGAQARFEQALLLAPNDASAQVAMGSTAALKGDDSRALDWYEKARSGHPRALQPRVLLAQYYVAQGDFKRALALAEEAIAIAPENAATLNVLGVALTASGAGEAGVAKLSAAARRVPNSAAYRFSLAQAYLRGARPVEALGAAREALAIDPAYAPALGLVVALAIERSDFAEAERALGQLRSVAPRAPATRVLEGDLRARQGKFHTAVEPYRAAYRERPSARLAMKLFLAMHAAGDAEALQPLETWVRSRPADGRGHALLAEAQRQLGQTSQATASYERAVQLEGSDAFALNNLAWLYYARGDRRAAATAAKAYELVPASAAISDTYGWILIETGELERGLQILQQANRAAPENADIRYHLAAALARSGNTSGARQLLEETLSSAQPFAERAAAERLQRTLEPANPVREQT